MDQVFKVEGMMCPHCKARVEKVCKTISGVTEAVADLHQKQVTVSGSINTEEVIKAIENAGYQVVR